MRQKWGNFRHDMGIDIEVWYIAAEVQRRQVGSSYFDIIMGRRGGKTNADTHAPTNNCRTPASS